jgi:hypothetical protein
MFSIILFPRGIWEFFVKYSLFSVRILNYPEEITQNFEGNNNSSSQLVS